MAHLLRTARLADAPAIDALIGRSARGLGAGDYTPAQIEAALTGAFGLDTELVTDGTYFVATTVAGAIIGCGGWSRRRTLFGSDQQGERDSALLDPRMDAARIRAFFVDPGHARHGIGAAILAHCEAEARRAGFRSFALMATVTGVRLYARYGYTAGEPLSHPLGPGLAITFVPMTKHD